MAQEEQPLPPPVPQFIMARPIPEFYTDLVRVDYSAVTIMFTFSIAVPNQPQREQAIVRMSPEHAKLMAIILRKSFKAYEQERGAEISIPASVLEQQGVSLEQDW
jgi:hypothetical protein